MSFIDVRFPKQQGYGSVGGPRFLTEVVETANKREKRNRVWTDARRRYDLTITARTQSEAEDIHEFHAAMGGREHSFRFWDPLDYKLTAQAIGTGDGSTDAFQIVKTYTQGSATHTRTIEKPIASGFAVYVNDVLKSPSTDYALDTKSGIITFTVPPADSAVITVTGEFDVPVRFVEDELRWVVVDSEGIPPDKYLWRPESLNLIEVIGEGIDEEASPSG